ncbi:uncharacterized protein LOC127050244 [Gopherus flavomarginatus]|uniref:uncharacterized protein LOC127050244 n=1 Tax=Gopherus flavomarginatus TaxID=286002 RepID=UPI0021CC14E6|nr:uncharacterized protein LOC127050244 [Gopherus flavomarginatus]
MQLWRVTPSLPHHCPWTTARGKLPGESRKSHWRTKKRRRRRKTVNRRQVRNPFSPQRGTMLNAGANSLPHSQCGLPDHDPGESTSGANVSTQPLSTPSQRLVQIRRWKKRTREDMSAELMQSSRTDRVQLNACRQTIEESHKALQEHEEWRDACDESRQDAMVKLMGEQTDILPYGGSNAGKAARPQTTAAALYNHPPSSPSSIPSSPRYPRT